VYDEKRTIKKCLKNNALAQRELYEEHKVKWFMICLRYAHNKDEAQDMLQEGLINVFNNLKQFDSSKGNFSVWSNKVIVNAALQQLRKCKKLNFDESITDYENKLSNNEEVLAQIGAKELTKMVQSLPEGYRVVFNLYVVEGYMHREIGEILGISENTSKTQLLKAKRMLRNQLEKVLHY
jgi:RNA polymerase sigma factor (sigma-70 family)